MSTDRSWRVERGVYEDGTPEDAQEFRARVRAKLIDAESVGDMIGGAFSARPQRVRDGQGEWVTVAWNIAWISEHQAKMATGEWGERPEPEPEPEPLEDPEPELVAVGAEDEPKSAPG